MSNEITIRDTAHHQPSLLDPGALEAAKQVARVYIDSGMCPKHLTPSAVLIGLDIARRQGLDPLFVLQNLYQVHGTYGWSAKYLVALAAHSGRFRGPIDYEVSGSGGSLEVTAFVELSHNGQRREVTVTMAQAREAGWTKNPMYRSIPEQMLCYRAATFLVRRYCPEVLCGLYTADELHDIRASRGEVVDAEVIVEPRPQRLQVAEVPLSDRLDRAVSAFGKMGLSLQDLEGHLGEDRVVWGLAALDALTILHSDMSHGRTTAEAIKAANEAYHGAAASAVVEWTKAQAIAFQHKLDEIGVSYRAAVELCLESLHMRPSQLTEEQRSGFVSALEDRMLADAQTLTEAIDELTERVRAFSRKEIHEACSREGVETTAPGKMGSAELRSVLSVLETMEEPNG